jgi:hypothetical protein
MQLDVLPQFATGLPSHFAYHPFRFVDFKEQAQIWKQAAKCSAVRTTERKQRFYMDFGFMHASASDYSRPDKTKDRVVQSFDGYSSYLLIIDEASHFVWTFLTALKEPPLDIIREFLTQHGHSNGGSVRTNQGGKLARCSALQDMLLRNFFYMFEPTGIDSPSQNSAVEIYNDNFAVRTQTLLYGSGLPDKYWSAALVHSVYLHNRLVHSATKRTPFEGYYGQLPDLSSLKLFGSWVCIKRTENWRGKLDRHNFTGIFIGYTALAQNIIYIDLESELVKHSHHAQFDKAWYLQPHCPPAAQLLYNLGLEDDDEAILSFPVNTTNVSSFALWPPISPYMRLKDKWSPPLLNLATPLPLQELSAQVTCGQVVGWCGK